MPLTTARRTAIGWSVLDRAAVPAYVIPVTGGTVTMRLRPGDTATILVDLVKRFDATVEPVLQGEPDDWSYNPRKVRENSTIWSEHAAGTAIDLNAVAHFRGAKGTFTEQQLRAIGRLLDLYEGVVDWGGKFRTTPDEMHFEIGLPPGDPKIKRVAAKIRALEDDMSEADVKRIIAAIPTKEAVAAEAYKQLTTQAFTKDEEGVNLDKRPPVQIALVAARNTEKLVAVTAGLAKLVSGLVTSTADDATKAELAQISGKLDQLIEASIPDPAGPPA